MLWPDAGPAGGENAVRIDRVLDGFVDAKQRVIVEGVGRHYRVLERRRRSVFPPTVLGRDLDEAFEEVARAFVLRLVTWHASEDASAPL